MLTTLFLVMLSPARAEEPLKITTMNVSVWPEYDQPGVLVQYQGNVAAQPTKTAPVELSFLVPKGAGVGAACAIQTNGNHTSETWKEAEADTGLTKVTFKVTEPIFHVEYYYNPLPAVTDKQFSFAYTAAIPADEVELDVQHPLKATNFALTPDAPNTHKDQDGFTYHAYSFKQVAAGQKLSTDVAYTKTDPKPSVSGDKPASSPSAASTASDNGINPNQVIVLATAFAVAGILGFFIWQRNRRDAQDRFARAESFDEGPRPAARSEGGYCTQCGNAMEAGDRFCARCGSPVSDA
jgi:hypothetical protein